MIGTFQKPLLEVRGLQAFFGSPERPVRAVDGVSFTIRDGETVALVGESGCGKSATALSLAGLLPEPGSFRAGGEILFDGKTDPPRRGRDIAYVFQEPASSLNPVLRVERQIGEAIRLHRVGVNVREETLRLLNLVGLDESKLRAYPHQLSGGQQQRVMIAMALAGRPKLLVADEPTTALDVTIQAQILDLLVSLQREFGMAMLLITHNLGLVAQVAHSLYIMYAGRIVEGGPAVEVLRDPKHPYTRALLEAVPTMEGAAGRLKGIDGSVPNLGDLPSGCKFHPRCPKCQAICRETEPARENVSETRGVRCHFWNKS